jgi:hypothetical protein
MRRLSGVCLAIAAVALLPTAASAQGTSIVPGASIGDLYLGEDLPVIVTSLGPLHSQDDLPGHLFTGYFWPLKRIGVIADKESNKIVALAISLDDSYQTEKGIAAGTEMDSIRSAYGPEDSVETHEDDDTLIYDKLGVAFVVDKSGALGSRVSLILVFTSGHYHNIFKSP